MTPSMRAKMYRTRAKHLQAKAQLADDRSREELLAIADAYLKRAEQTERSILH